MTKNKILIVDDEESIAISLKRILTKFNYEVSIALSGEEAFKMTKKNSFNLVITDIIMPGMDGITLMQKLKDIDTNLQFVIITAQSSISGAVEAIKRGAHNYLPKPFEIENVVNVVKNVFDTSLNYSENMDLIDLGTRKIIWRSEQMTEIFKLVRKIALSDSTILITGESGTGKELVARAIHEFSSRKIKKFVAVNCSAIPNELLESELFGHTKGAFTGAIQNRIGRFEIANGGTIFLDEIGDMNLALQAKILRVLQEKNFDPVGSSESKDIDARVITATNTKLEEAIKNKSFREDLYYRLNVIPIHIPALKERKDDIEPLIYYFIEKFNSKANAKIEGVEEEVLNVLRNYDWPGNIRELENLIERMVVLKLVGKITLEDIPDKYLTQNNKSDSQDLKKLIISSQGVDLNNVVDEFENDLILQALKRTNWNKNKAAQILGINRTTLVEKIKKKNLSQELSC